MIANDQVGSNAAIAHAELGYAGLVAGQKYAIVLGQATIAEDGSDYRWMASADTSNPDWWKPDARNPQVRQDGQDLSSGKYDGSNWVDESHVGDYCPASRRRRSAWTTVSHGRNIRGAFPLAKMAIMQSVTGRRTMRTTWKKRKPFASNWIRLRRRLRDLHRRKAAFMKIPGIYRLCLC